MGHARDATAEQEQLRQLIRDAHAAAKDLRAVIREARGVGAVLAEAVSAELNAELAKATNHLQAEQNRHSAELNTAVGAARQEILRQLAVSRIEYDQEADNWRIVFGGGRFDDAIPPPYPERG